MGASVCSEHRVSQFQERKGDISPRSSGEGPSPRERVLPSPTCEISLSFPVSPDGVVILMFFK